MQLECFALDVLNGLEPRKLCVLRHRPVRSCVVLCGLEKKKGVYAIVMKAGLTLS